MNATKSKWLRRVVIALLGIVLICAAGIFWLRHRNLADVTGGVVKESLAVTSTSFADGGQIPAKFTCDKGFSPALSWTEPPAGTQSMAVIMEDPDALFGFIHWIVYNLPSGTRAIPEGAYSKLPHGAKRGRIASEKLDTSGPVHHLAVIITSSECMRWIPALTCQAEQPKSNSLPRLEGTCSRRERWSEFTSVRLGRRIKSNLASYSGGQAVTISTS